MAYASRTSSDGKKVYYIPSTECCHSYVEWRHGEAPPTCPVCGNQFYGKPKHEFVLFTMQDVLLQDWDRHKDKILGEQMFPVFVEYAENLIKLRLKGKCLFTPEKLNEKACNAAMRLLETILKTPGHRIVWSFGGLLRRLCAAELYGNQRVDEEYSLNSSRNEGEKELGDYVILSQDNVDHTNKTTATDISKHPCFKSGEVLQVVHELVDRAVVSLQTEYGECEIIEMFIGASFRTIKNKKPYSEFMSTRTFRVADLVSKLSLLIDRYLKTDIDLF